MTWWEALLLVGGGLAAGFINANAGGGSILTVPLLTLAGVPGGAANGSNRVGVLTSNMASATAFRQLGVRGLRAAWPILLPTIAGSLVGSFVITRLTDDAFERTFGLIMLPVALLSLRPPRPVEQRRTWPRAATVAAFAAVGVYGGAVQAGVGLIMLALLTRAGYDLVNANNVKVAANLLITAVALPVFVWQGKVAWGPAAVLALGFTAGGWFGAHAAVKGGERLIRAVMLVAATLLAADLLGVFDRLF